MPSSRATIAAGTRPPRVMQTTASNGPAPEEPPGQRAGIAMELVPRHRKYFFRTGRFVRFRAARCGIALASSRECVDLPSRYQTGIAPCNQGNLVHRRLVGNAAQRRAPHPSAAAPSFRGFSQLSDPRQPALSRRWRARRRGSAHVRARFTVWPKNNPGYC